MKIEIRPFRESDTNFVISTWIKSYYSNVTGYREKQSIFLNGLEKLIKSKHLKDELACLVACTDEDQDLILGFAVYGHDKSLHYIYTKSSFQGLGVSKLLMQSIYKDTKEVTVSHWTKDIAHLKKNYSITYDRFKFYN